MESAMEEKEFRCKQCKNTFMRQPDKARQYCSSKCKQRANDQIKLKKHWINQLKRFNLPADTPKMCQACSNPITEYGFHVACSQECRNEIDERNRIQAQKKPCKKCGNDITRAKSHKYCSDKCRYEAWRDGKRKHPKNSNCKRCKNTITDKNSSYTVLQNAG